MTDRAPTDATSSLAAEHPGLAGAPHPELAGTEQPAEQPAEQPRTAVFDIGGTGLKAAVLDASGRMITDRVRVRTPYPCPPARLVTELAGLYSRLTAVERASVGFPGMVRHGVVLSAPKFDTVAGPGSPVSSALAAEWRAFPLAEALAEELGVPVRVANDADVQGAAVVAGHGYELVLTLGTGFGTAAFYDGTLLPHVELAHHPFRKGETYEEQVGELARKAVGGERWTERVKKAVTLLRASTSFSHCYIGGGNARRLPADLASDVTIVPNTAGLLGGIALWNGRQPLV